MLKKFFGKYEYILFFLTIFLCAFGLLFLYSASSYYCINNYQNQFYLAIRQGIFIGAGLIILLFVSFLPYKIYLKFSFIIYMASFFLIILTFFIGVASRGSTRWIEINGLTFQPSELMKIGIVLYLSNTCGDFLKNRDSYDEVQYKKELYRILAYGFVPSFIISVSNLSTGIICGFITLFYVFIISKKKLIFLIIFILIVSTFFFKEPIAMIIERIGILKQYQMNRILAWVSPKDYQDIAYQTNQSLYAIGSGGIFGRGLGQSLQKMIIPDAQNDMIYAVIAEEVGIVGSIFILCLYALLIGRIFYLAYNNTGIKKSLLLYGIGIHIFMQVILNLSVCLNIIPNTGITLPFISYGGSSLLVTLFEIGVVISISK